MSQTTIKELGHANRRHVDIASIATGVVIGLLNLSLANFLGYGQTQRAGQVFVSCVGAFVAGFVAASLCVRRSGGQEQGLGCRLGVRAGIHAALWTGAALSVTTTLRTLNAASAIDELILKAHMWMTLLVSFASLLPGVLSGFVGGLIARPLQSESAASDEAPSSPDRRWISRILLALGCLCFASPLIFLARSPKVDPLPPVVQVKRSPTPPLPPPPPPFHFRPPKDIKEATFGQLNVDSIKSISGVDTRSPYNLTPDYSLFAYTGRSQQGQTGVMVYDLNWLREIAQFPLPTVPQSTLAWEPEFHRLACVTGSNPADRRVWILSLDSGRAVELPRPKNRDIPGGDVHWWTKTELAFFPTDEPPLVLDLVDLRLNAIEMSPYFKESDGKTKKQWMEGPREVLPTFTKWRPDIVTVLSAIDPPSRREPNASWSIQSINSWAFVDDKLPVVHLLPQLPVKIGTTLLCAPDASKMLMLHDGSVDVIYMRTAPAPKWLVHAELPFTREGIIDATAESDITSLKVCAFVYAPLINPLNAKCVGPNHNRLKAVLRLQKWNGHSATFVVVQRREDFGAADVVADLHTWENGELKPWRFLDKPDWWTTVGESPEGSLPAVSESVSIDGLELPNNHTAVLNTDRWIVQNRPRTEPKKKAAAQPVVKTSAPSQTPAQGPAAGQDTAEIQAVKAFIEEHHRKASSGELDAVMADYADLVDFMSRGRILRDRIQQDEINQRELWPRSTESIKDGVTIESKGADGWKANYSITFRNENTTGGWQSGVADLELEIAKFRTGFRITGHKAKVHDVTTGQGAASASTKAAGAPAVKIRLPSPVWATTMNMRIGDQKVSVHEALALVQGHLIIHRTYRVLVDSNTPKEVAKQHPDGIISMQTAEIEGSIQRAGPNAFTALIGRQGWVQAPDASAGIWSAACEAHAARMVGTALTFKNEGEDLVSGGVRFRLTKSKQP